MKLEMAEMAPEGGKPRVLAFAGREGQGGVDYWEGDRSTPLFFPSSNRAPPRDIDMWGEA